MPVFEAFFSRNRFQLQNLGLRKLAANDMDAQAHYLKQLSEATKKRFGPHLFDKAGMIGFYRHHTGISGYVAVEKEQGAIIAYKIIKSGYLPHDHSRLSGCGLLLNPDFAVGIAMRGKKAIKTDV